MTRGSRGRHGRRRPLAGLTVVAMVAAMVAGTAALTWASGAIQGPASTSAASIQSPEAGNALVRALLGRMTLADKLRLLEWATAPGQQGATGHGASAGPGAAASPGAASPGVAGPGTAPGALAATGTVGEAPCGNPGPLIQILRRELGFTGFVLAGPGANPGTLSLDSGLDGEIPAPGRAATRYFTPAALRAAIASRTITTATVNQAAAAVLTEMDLFGLLGPQPAHRAAIQPAAADARVISRTATDAATLLRDAGHALPLSSLAP